LLAVKVMLYAPAVPAPGVPLRIFVELLNVTPLGSLPASVMDGVGVPVAVTVKDPARPTVKIALFTLVTAGGWPAALKFAITLCGAFMVMVVEALPELATLPVQSAKV
jgi:hypothetical protein